MKILHVSYSDAQGGAATSVRRLHESFLKNNYNSWLFVLNKIFSRKNVLTLDNAFDLFFYLIKKKVSKFFCKLFKIFSKTDYSISFFSGSTLQYVKRIKPDIVNLHWICNETLSIEELPKIGKPVVWTMLDMWPFLGAQHIDLEYKNQSYWRNENFKKNFYFDINYWVFKRKLKSFNFDFELVAISNWLANKASESVLFRNKKISVIPCLLDFDEWNLLEKKSSRKKLNIDLNKKVILFSSAAGSSSQRKGFNFLINILKSLEKKILNDIHLIFIGNLNKKILKDLNISFSEFNNFFFGDPKILNIIYSSADLTIMPSLVEPFGQVALESAACNVPTLAFRNTGLEDLIIHKKNGYLANYLDIDDLIFGFNWCLDDYNNNIISKNCRKLAKEKFSEDVVVSQYNQIYLKLM